MTASATSRRNSSAASTDNLQHDQPEVVAAELEAFLDREIP